MRRAAGILICMATLHGCGETRDSGAPRKLVPTSHTSSGPLVEVSLSVGETALLECPPRPLHPRYHDAEAIIAIDGRHVVSQGTRWEPGPLGSNRGLVTLRAVSAGSGNVVIHLRARNGEEFGRAAYHVTVRPQ